MGLAARSTAGGGSRYPCLELTVKYEPLSYVLGAGRPIRVIDEPRSYRTIPPGSVVARNEPGSSLARSS